MPVPWACYLLVSPHFLARLKDNPYDPESLEGGWLDAIVMEQLTSSPFVLNVFGNCGVSQIIELGESSLHDLVKIARIKGDTMSSLDKLKVSFQVASATADMHSIGGDVPSFAHNDLDASQIILVDGTYKVNDFQYGSTKYENQNGTVCPQQPADMSGFVSLPK